MPDIRNMSEMSDSDSEHVPQFPQSASGLISHFESKSGGVKESEISAEEPENLDGGEPLEDEPKEIQTTIQRVNDKIPIDNYYALAKEKCLLKYYYGTPDTAAGDFIDSEILSLLDSQLLTPGLSIGDSKVHVMKYLANYSNWATFALYHSTKAANKVKL